MTEFYETSTCLGDVPLDAVEPIAPPREAGVGWQLTERLVIGKLAVFRWSRKATEWQEEERSDRLR
jgi:hypothetical protein